MHVRVCASLPAHVCIRVYGGETEKECDVTSRRGGVLLSGTLYSVISNTCSLRTDRHHSVLVVISTNISCVCVFNLQN